MAHEVWLDVSQLPAPQPLERILGALDDLKTGQFLHVLHRMEPHLLFDHLPARDLLYRMKKDSAGQFHILVWQAQDLESKAEAQNIVEGLI